MVITINVSIFGLLVDAFVRLKKIVTNQDIALQTNQMYFHIGAFAISTISIISLQSVLYHNEIDTPNPDNPNFYFWLNRQFRNLTITAELSSVGTALSTFALLSIFNSLINRSSSDDASEAGIQRSTYQKSSARLSI